MSESAGDAVARALGRPSDARVVDGLASIPDALAAFAAAAGEVVVKGLEQRSGPRETLDDLAGGAQFGPWPPSLVFMAVDAAGEVSLTSVAARAAGEASKVAGRVTSVELVSGAFDWFKPKAKRAPAAKADEPRATKWWAEVALAIEVDGAARTIIVGLAVAATDDAARAELEPLARAVTAWTRGERIELDAADGEPASMSKLHLRSGPATLDLRSGAARLAWGREGEVIVLRDYGNVGPSRYTGAYRTTSIVSLVVALALGGSIAIQSLAGAPVGALIGSGAVTLVLLVNAFAFFQIARFAGRYTSDSLALAWFGDDCVVVGPWLSRYGAVDTRPSGRLGAAIPTVEVNGIACFERDGEHAVEMASEHGPLEVVRTASTALAEDVKRFSAELLQAIAAPRKKPKKS